jgi:hypothetical protein
MGEQGVLFTIPSHTTSTDGGAVELVGFIASKVNA